MENKYFISKIWCCNVVGKPVGYCWEKNRHRNCNSRLNFAE